MVAQITYLGEAGPAEMRKSEAPVPDDTDEAGFAREAIEEYEGYWYVVVPVNEPDEPEAA